jgi:hypothetical protein
MRTLATIHIPSHGPLTGTLVNVKVIKSVIHITSMHLILDSPKVS